MMGLIHHFGGKTIKRSTRAIDTQSLMLGGDGDYLWIGKNSASRYQGWFCQIGGGLMKIIDDLRPAGAAGFLVLENDFWRVKRIWENNRESFFLPAQNCLAYEIENPAEIAFFLDIKESYKNPDASQRYAVWEEGGLILAACPQIFGSPLPEIFLAVAGDFKISKITNEWSDRDYEWDKKRASPPFCRRVFRPAAVSASRLVFAAGDDKKEAVGRARRILNDFEAEKSKKRTEFLNTYHRRVFWPALPGKTEISKTAARNALRMLVKTEKEDLSLRAGWPWFFQIWQRDEAVSLKGLAEFDKNAATAIFWRQLKELKKNKYHFDTADGAGWLFLRAAGFLKKNFFDGEEKREIADTLERTIGWQLRYRTRGGLAVNTDEKTWMDSIERPGACVEIQAQRLAMYDLARRLTDDPEKKEYYSQLKDGLEIIARKTFFDGQILADRFDVGKNDHDLICRPNLFLAAYIYPGLLEKNEWRTVFENALTKLWLDWGGLATIDKNDSRFCPQSTGENAKSYHNGDSWFWINNIAAIAMRRVAGGYFKHCIEKIFIASRHDVLWGGALGCASEISSAQSFDPAGCPNQAWSNATFLELCQELKK